MMTFGNRSLAVHLLRGAVGLGAVALSLATVNRVWWPTFLLMPLAVWMLRGCPMCWTIGLFESIAYKIHGRAEGRDAGKASGT